MQLKNIKTIFAKELKDTLRDRRTLIFMLFVPLLAMPGIMYFMMNMVMSQQEKIEADRPLVVIENSVQLPEDLRTILFESDSLTVKDASEFAGKKLVDEVKFGNIRVYIAVPENFATALKLESSTDLEVYYDNAEDKSSAALSKLRRIFNRYQDELIERRLTQRSLSKEILEPFEVNANSVASAQKQAGKVIGVMVPYILILMCFLGGMYPAIDLGAGEKERGTMETLLVAPALRSEFVIGKYGVIMLTSLVAGLMSMASMTYAMNKFMADIADRFQDAPSLALQFDLPTLALIIAIVLPMAGIFAAILLTVSIFSKSYKEAQGYIGVMNMGIILPAVISMLPGMELNYGMALVPIASASLIIKEAMQGTIQWNYVLVAFASSTIIAAACLYFCKKWFEREEVLFRM